ncbi:hypothetical protein ACQUJS_13830 [Ralstonia pseudosolanacearum]|uniref:Uncharacterized protein n=1 Tax=Ralstonia solanacearum TaxID=305 RepID=A0A0S4XK45_RALSL|nr:hypothetical protein RSP799_11125 [Ralstonia solanacearum]CUV11745.1 protein of unknown function [Ralstonia solanacearum]CUV64367.1 protein of unknown function [Ralstonia solanacearum]
MILADTETKVDLLNNEAIATTIIGLLRAKPEHPVTIGVHGMPTSTVAATIRANLRALLEPNDEAKNSLSPPSGVTDA